jgi:hypothetical protein
MAVSEIAKAIGRAFSRNYEVSIDPDHPYLFTSPDVLIGENGTLIAVFVPRNEEERAPQGLYARLIATRLALPSNTRCVLQLKRSKANALSNNPIVSQFDETFAVDSMSELRRYVNLQRRPSELERNGLSRIRQRHFAKTSILFEESQIRLRAERKIANPRRAVTALPLLEPARRRRDDQSETHLLQASRVQQVELLSSSDIPVKREPRQISPMRSGDAIYAAAVFGQGRSAIAQIKPFCITALDLDYILDNRVPYQTEDSAKVLNASERPVARFDPQKPVRAAAFAGWLVTQANSPQELQEAAEQVRRRLRERQL